MIQNEEEYKILVERIEALLQIPDNIENREAKGYAELNRLADLVADYEEQHHRVSQSRSIDRLSQKQRIRLEREKHLRGEGKSFSPEEVKKMALNKENRLP